MTSNDHHLNRLSSQIIKGIWATYPSSNNNNNNNCNHHELLDLVLNFYHEPSGLHNEGVWHNCLMAINYYYHLHHKNDEQQQELQQEIKNAMSKVVNSVIRLNYDNMTHMFHQRTETEWWSHENAASNAHLLQLYHRTEHRDHVYKLVSQVIALLMNTIVLYPSRSKNNNKKENDVCSMNSPSEQLREIHELFYHEQHQMYVTKIRHVPQHDHVGDDHVRVEPYFRAVDHALLLIAVVVMESKGIPLLLSTSDSYDHIKGELRRILLEEFGFGHVSNIKSYIDMDKKDKKPNCRFLWQDVWVYLALLISSNDDDDIINNNSVIQEGVENFFSQFMNDHNGLLYGEPKPETYDLNTLDTRWISVKSGTEKRMVYVSPNTNYFFNCYTGDNAILFGLLKACESYGCTWINTNEQIQRFMNNHFQEMLRDRAVTSEDQQKTLFAISDMMHSTAIWSNSELLFAIHFIRNIKEILQGHEQQRETINE